MREQHSEEATRPDTQTESPRRPRRWGRLLLLLGLVMVLTSGVAAGALWYLNTAPEHNGDAVTFSVRRGESVQSIARRLEAEGLIRSARMLSLLSVVRGTQDRFQSGNYLIPAGLSTQAIHDFFLGGRQRLVRITIPEGWTIRRMADHLEGAGIISADEFIAATGDPEVLGRFAIAAESAQGFLYPDTYLFQEGLPASTIVAHMIERFFAVVESVYPAWQLLTPEELYETVIMASIVEREYMVPDEAPMIASVFFNRLNVGMRLESCATVVYVMTEEQGLPHPSRLFFRDLERNSTFNTYRNRGLPPAPIANPGRVALDAAFNPAESDYWFFVLRGADATRHHFSRSFQEHNEATVFYLRSPR